MTQSSHMSNGPVCIPGAGTSSTVFSSVSLVPELHLAQCGCPRATVARISEPSQGQVPLGPECFSPSLPLSEPQFPHLSYACGSPCGAHPPRRAENAASSGGRPWGAGAGKGKGICCSVISPCARATGRGAWLVIRAVRGDRRAALTPRRPRAARRGGCGRRTGRWDGHGGGHVPHLRRRRRTRVSLPRRPRGGPGSRLQVALPALSSRLGGSSPRARGGAGWRGPDWGAEKGLGAPPPCLQGGDVLP